eukprot:2010632-Lingulodinium_polyedra.AAC.1
MWCGRPVTRHRPTGCPNTHPYTNPVAMFVARPGCGRPGGTRLGHQGMSQKGLQCELPPVCLLVKPSSVHSWFAMGVCQHAAA